MQRWLQPLRRLRPVSATARAFARGALGVCNAFSRNLMPSARTTSRHAHPLVAFMARVGFARVVIIATLGSAVLSALIAWLVVLAIDVPNYRLHVFLAFLIPLLVTPGFSYLTALSVRDLKQARARSRQLAEEAENERQHLQTAVNNMPIGLVMFDAGKRLIVGNDRYREMYRLPASAMDRGTHLRTMLEHRLESGNFEGERDAYVDRILKLVEQKETTVRVVKLGNERAVNIIHHPLETGGWIGTHEDVTEREKLGAQIASQNELLRDREDRLHTQNALFEAALRNMSQGLCMFDRNNRLVLCNEQYRRMYALSPEQSKAGITLGQLLEHRMASGSYPKGPPPSTYVAGLMESLGESSTWSKLTELQDGRFVSVVNCTMPDGGWVATHEDVSSLRAVEQELRAQNLRFDAAINNMSQGLCMFDANQRLVICNERYAELYALPARLTQPGTHLRDILAERVANGLYAGEQQEGHTQTLLTIAAQNAPATKVTELNNGRTIVIKHRPMDGGGWVATHEDITEQRRIEARIEHMAHHDALTDLPNRFLLRRGLENALERATPQHPVAVLCLDFDRFKDVNDTLGHTAGDTLLKVAAERLRACVRSNDTVARLGGDEFAIVQTGTAQPAGSIALAQRVIAAIEAPYDINGHQAIIGTSVGISMCSNGTTDTDRLLKNADLALYKAKTDGRGTYRFFEPGMDERLHARRRLEMDLRGALASGAFELHYQPIVNLKSSKVVVFEALLRWNHPERGRVAPADFIPLAEEIGLIGSIGEWTIRAACAEAASWPRAIGVAVNLSPLQFKQDDLVQLVFSALATSGLEPNRLELEITESVLLENTERTLSTLNELRRIGVRVSMDDFGTGYSSLSNLRGFPFDKIKIDKSFIQGLGKDEQCPTIIQAVTALGTGLGMTITAEGVETREQLELLRGLGVNEVQGYYICRPAPAAEALRAMANFTDKAGLAA
jgi:diguanylate cyclase (GGDEF)-like protein